MRLAILLKIQGQGVRSGVVPGRVVAGIQRRTNVSDNEGPKLCLMVQKVCWSGLGGRTLRDAHASEEACEGRRSGGGLAGRVTG